MKLLFSLFTLPCLVASSRPSKDLLGRMYDDFQLFNGAEVRIAASDSDVADAILDPKYILPLEELRKHVYNGGELPDTGATPGELSLALTDDLSMMRISWATMDKTIENPRVELLSPCTLDGCIYSADTTTYTVPQKWWPIFNGSLHSSIISGIVSGESYTYRVCSDSPSPSNMTESCSDYYTFNAPPVLSTPTNIAIIGDQGTVMPLGFAISEKLTNVQDEMGIDAVIHVGDLSYAGIDTAMPHLNVSKDDEFEWIWDLWQLQNQPIAATRPYMVGIGNHEAWYNWTAVTSRFHMPPGPVIGAQPPFWYSMNHGYVHWIQTCSEFPIDSSSPQGQWLASDLAYAFESSQHEVIPWVVLTIHRPPYGSESSWLTIRSDLELLFNQYKVDLVICGHIHAYERTHSVGNNGNDIEYPLFKDEDGNDIYSNPTYPLYITQGNSGGLQMEKWIHPAPEWSAIRWANGYEDSLYGDDEMNNKNNKEEEDGATSLPDIYPYTYTDTFGFGVAHFVNATSMYYESISVTGNFTDKFWISREIN